MLELDTTNYEVEICHTSTFRFFGWFEHYFLRIKQIDLEIHPGVYQHGTHKKYGDTLKFTVLKIVNLCKKCIVDMLTESLHVQLVWYYPLVNCESLTLGLAYNAPISVQMISHFGLFISLALTGYSLKMLFVAVIFLLLSVYSIGGSYDEKVAYHKCIHLV